MSSGDVPNPEVARRDIQELFRRGQRLAEALLDENARLRAQLALEPSRGNSARTDERLDEAERELDRLANLYIAAAQLHACLAVEDTLRAMAEIVINLVGARSFCIYVSNGPHDALRPVFSEGVPLEERSPRMPSDADIAEALTAGVVELNDGKEGTLAAVVPLTVERELMGALIIESLLEQKESFSELDRELLEMLKAQAGSALAASALFEQLGPGTRLDLANAVTEILNRGPQA